MNIQINEDALRLVLFKALLESDTDIMYDSFSQYHAGLISFNEFIGELVDSIPIDILKDNLLIMLNPKNKK